MMCLVFVEYRIVPKLHSMALFDDVPEEDFAANLDEAKQKLRQTLLSSD